MRLYAYCLIEDLPAEILEGAAGVGGSPLVLVRRGPLSAVVSEFDARAVPATRENVLEHSRVNALVLARTTPLPFRFGTLADERRLADYMEKSEGQLLAALARVRGCVEMGAKVIWDAAAGAQVEAEAEAEDDDAMPAPQGSGTAFLLAKRRAALGDESQKRRAEEVAGLLAARLEGLARESAVEVNPSGSLVVRAAHLVARGREEEYRERVRALGRERDDLRLVASGPWPPYSFSGTRP
jgi:hypothetical protein